MPQAKRGLQMDHTLEKTIVLYQSISLIIVVYVLQVGTGGMTDRGGARSSSTTPPRYSTCSG